MSSQSVPDLESPLGEIPSDWALVQLKDITTKIGSGATPRGGQEVYLAKRINFALVRSQNVFDRWLSPEGLAFITDEHADELKSVWLEPNDILLNITGDGITFARACTVPENILPACVNQHVSIIRADRRYCDPGFIVSYLTHPSVKPYIESFNAGGSRRAITKGHIESFVLPLPPLAEQRAIAHILGSLDDKIEFNRRMNATLEAMARAIFRSWFVDFDPVHAKASGEQPSGMDADPAALFPDSFEESELGMIPRGWRIVPIGEITAINDWILGKNDKLERIEYIEISEVMRGDIGEISIYDRDNEPSRARRRLRHGDAVLSTVRPDRGAHFLCLNPSPYLIASTGFAVITPVDVPWSFVYAALTQPAVSEYLGNLADGGAYPAVRPEIIGEWTVAFPENQAILSAFHEVCSPLYELADHNRRNGRILAELRDTLLPRLISGELRVKDIEVTP